MSNFSFNYFEDDEFPTLFAALKQAFDAADVPFYLIGARARDVWFLPEKSMRITKDIDWIALKSSKPENEVNQIVKNLFEGISEDSNFNS